MERKNTQKSTLQSNFFQIPLEYYEKDMEGESSKEKKKEILELFTTYNRLRSKEEFNEIKFHLHEACRDGDLELIKILLSETITNSREGLIFKIDETNKTASLFNVKKNIKELIVPRTVEYNSTEYLITSIIKTGLYLETIKFSEDSAVKTFHGKAFSSSKIEEIHFPASLKELKEGWYYGFDYLKKIIISPSNDQFKFINNKYLIGKSDSNNTEFDTLLIVRRDIKEFSIPSNIKFISPRAFYHCRNLTKVEIPTNSNLQTIESEAFVSSNIESIFIPSKVTKIGKYAFSFCRNLTKVEIPTNSILQTIESQAFLLSKIEEIYFPTSLKELKKGWFYGIDNLKKIIISPSNDKFKFIDNKYLIGKSDLNNTEFDTLLYVRRDNNEFSIPSNIKIISSYVFIYRRNLTKIEIPTNSNLQTIESDAFSSSNIESIFIPSKVTKICEFDDCNNLQIIVISEESKLLSLSLAFEKCKRTIIMIPSSLRKLINTNIPI